MLLRDHVRWDSVIKQRILSYIQQQGIHLVTFEITPSKFLISQFLVWLSRLKTQHSLCEDACSILGLTQWVKDLVLLQAAVQVTGVAQMWCCCDVGLSCSSDSTRSPGISSCKKEKKVLQIFFLFLFFFAPPMAYASSRGQIQTTAMTYAVTTPDP